MDQEWQPDGSPTPVRKPAGQPTSPPARPRSRRQPSQQPPREHVGQAGHSMPTSRVALRQAEKADFGRSLRATALSFFLPGIGLLRTKRRNLGIFQLASTALALLALGVLVVQKGVIGAGTTIASRPGLMTVIMVALGVMGVLWVLSIVMTSQMSRPKYLDRSRARTLIAVTAVLALMASFVTVKSVQYAAVTKDVVASVFGGDKNTPSDKTGVKIAEGTDPWADQPRVNVLLLGSDAGAGRTGTRTDSMVVASIDTKTGNTVLFSLPRNLQNVPFPASNPLHEKYPNGYDCGSECLLNAVWTEAENYKHDNPTSFAGDKNPGLTTTRDVISEVLGIPINYYVIIDLAGFEQLVDAMGGVNVVIRERVCIDCKVNSTTGAVVSTKGQMQYLEPGPEAQHLDGRLALWYARSRALSADGDFSRMRRQRCVISALLKQVNPISMLQKYQDLATVAKNNVSTNVGLDELEPFATLVQRIQKGKITSLAFTQTNTNTGRPDFDKIHKLVAAALVKSNAKPTSTSKPSTTTATSGTMTTTPTGGATTTVPTNPDEAEDVNAAC